MIAAYIDDIKLTENPSLATVAISSLVNSANGSASLGSALSPSKILQNRGLVHDLELKRGTPGEFS